MCYMFNPTKSNSVRKLKAYNIKYAWLLLRQSKVQHIIKCMKNWVLNQLNLERGFKDYMLYKKISFIKIQKYHHNILLNNHQHNTRSRNLLRPATVKKINVMTTFYGWCSTDSVQLSQNYIFTNKRQFTFYQ